ncbi:MAG: adenosine deaminase family protein, partial [Candidatus Hodarchaeales archaeon]
EYFFDLVQKHEPSSKYSKKSKIKNLYNFSTFEGFLKAYSTVVSFLRDLDDIKNLAKLVVSQLKKENIIYAELIFSPQPLIKTDYELKSLLQTLYQEFRNSNVETRLIIDIVRNFGVEEADNFVTNLIPMLSTDLGNWIKAISIGGDEINYPAKMFQKIFLKARKNGFFTYAHAGEWSGVENIWDAIHLLNVRRVGHGIKAINDPKLITYLLENNIGLDISPTSNYLTGAIGKGTVHPLKNFYEYGLSISINTDDPGFFKTDLNKELLLVYQMGITLNEIKVMQRKLVDYTLLTNSERNIILKKLK